MADDNSDEWTARMHPSIHSVRFNHCDAESILADVLSKSAGPECDHGAKEFLGPDRARSAFWTARRAVLLLGLEDLGERYRTYKRRVRP